MPEKKVQEALRWMDQLLVNWRQAAILVTEYGDRGDLAQLRHKMDDVEFVLEQVWEASRERVGP